VRGALSLARARDPALVGAFLWWAFDIGVLWMCFKAFGQAPPGGVVVMGYLTGTLGNVIPLPGGVGGVEGAMIGVPGLRRRCSAGRGRRARLAGVRVLAADHPRIAYLRLRRTVRGWDADEITQSM
jgi:putative heme transporter